MSTLKAKVNLFFSFIRKNYKYKVCLGNYSYYLI